MWFYGSYCLCKLMWFLPKTIKLQCHIPILLTSKVNLSTDCGLLNFNLNIILFLSRSLVEKILLGKNGCHIKIQYHTNQRMTNSLQTMMLRVLKIIQTSRWNIKNVQQKTNGWFNIYTEGNLWIEKLIK